MIRDLIQTSINRNSLSNTVSNNIKLSDNFNDFKKKMKVFTLISEGEKIGKYNGEYYIFSNTWSRQMWRWYYNENRNNTFSYLNSEFEEFVKFLDLVIQTINTEVNKTIYTKLINKINFFIKNIIVGLYNLKKTYIDCDKLNNKIDSIILTLIDFKNESNDIMDIKYSNYKTRSLSEDN